VIRFVAAFLFALTALWAQADANKGQIVGTVYDQNQAVVPGASVKIKNIDTGLTRDLTTNEAGQYRVVLLDPGRYELAVEKQGFAAARVTGVVLNVGSAVTADVTLQVGTTIQTVEVAEALLSVTTASPSTVVNGLAITDLPINGRRFQDFAVMTPTVQVDPDRGQLSFAGQRGINSNVMVDGADYNQPFFGGIRGGERSNFIFTVPQSAIQEFQAVATGYSAEYGRSSGGVLNAITKSGANDMHGDAFYQLRHKELGLQTPFKRQILETQHQFGGSIGGPIKKDKLFWFAAVERQQARTPRQIVFGPLATIAPATATAQAYNYYKSLEGPFNNTNDATALTGRGDYQFSGGHRLTLRYNFSDATAQNAAGVGGPTDTLTNNALNTNGDEKDRTQSGVAQLTSILSPNIANDMRFSGSYELRPRTSNSQVAGVTNTIGTFGTRLFFPNTQNDKRMQVNDGLSMTHGPHTFKFGVDYNYLTADQIFGFNQFGVFSFLTTNVNQILTIMSGAAGNRFDDPAVEYNRQIGNLAAAFNMHQFAFYAQNSWRATSKLTLDLGLRWEGQWNPQPDANNTAVVNLVKGFVFPNGLKVDPTVAPNNLNQVMPRFGFAWTPLADPHRTVLRGHAGLFYAATPLLLFAGANNNFRLPPGDVSVKLPRTGSTVYRDLLAIGVDLNQFTLDKLPVLTAEQVQRAASGGGTVDPFRGVRLITNAADYRNPRAFQAGLGVDHEVVRNWIASVQFNYVNTVHLQRNRDYNLQAPVIRAGDQDQRPFVSRGPRPIASLDRITIRETSARSMYRGVSFSTQYRRNRLQFGAHYTLSEAFSDDDNERNATGLFYDNPYNLRNEYGYSILDRRHQFAGNMVAFLPWGIEVSAIGRALSGRPIDPAGGSDLNGDGSTSDRAYKAPGVLFERNSFRNRSFTNVDFRFLKNFKLWSEKSRLQFSCEMFNLFNIDNVIYDRTNLNYGPGIDRATGAVVPPLATFRRLRLANGDYDPTNNQLGTPFQAQFGLRLFF
jgi:hypothetical protein